MNEQISKELLNIILNNVFVNVFSNLDWRIDKERTVNRLEKEGYIKQSHEDEQISPEMADKLLNNEDYWLPRSKETIKKSWKQKGYIKQSHEDELKGKIEKIKKEGKEGTVKFIDLDELIKLYDELILLLENRNFIEKLNNKIKNENE